MIVDFMFQIGEYTGSHTEFVDLYNKWQEATVFLSTRDCCGKEWDELIAYGKEHQEEVKEVLREFLSVEGNDGNWMAMEVLANCCPEVNEKIKFKEDYVPPRAFHKVLMEYWDLIFKKE